MSRETYLRVRYAREGVENIGGLEFRRSDELGKLKTLVKVRMKAATSGLMPGRYDDNAEAIANSFDKYWPDRKMFVEVGDDSDAWIQVFDPRQVFCPKCCGCGAKVS